MYKAQWKISMDYKICLQIELTIPMLNIGVLENISLKAVKMI